MEVVDPGYAPAKAPVIEVINRNTMINMTNMINMITVMLDMMKMIMMTKELAGAKMQLLRRKQDEVGKVRTIPW